MPTRTISSRLHGILDYTTGATLMAAPAVLGLGGTPAGRILRGAGAGHVAYSALTRYELGAAKVLPYKAHLAMDAVAAAALAAAPWLSGSARSGRAHWLPHMAFAVWELGAIALSDPGGAGADAKASAPGALAMDVKSAPAAEPASSHPTERETVMPDGAEANLEMGARTIGGGERVATGGGVGSGTASPGSDPGFGGQQA